MKAAIALSNMNCQVYIIEKEHFIGGRIAQWGEMFTTNEIGEEIVLKLYESLIQRQNVTFFTGAEVIANSGSIGDFKLKIRISPRYVKENVNEAHFEKLIEVCPVEVANEFDFGISYRKAIYKNYKNAIPHSLVIDINNCTRCGKCEEISTEVDFSQSEIITEINVGSVLMATGFDPYTPINGEFGFNEFGNVVTLPQFKRMIELNDKKLIFKGKEIKNIAYIYCVGSRQNSDGNTYCSRYCCTSTIHTSVLAKKKFKNIYNFHFTRGIRTYGKQEVIYAESLKLGDIYLQAFEDALPEVYVKNDKSYVKINDILTINKEMEIEADLIVLVTGMVPRQDNSIGSMFKLPKGRDKFFNEIHMKLRPVETVIDGTTIAGTCQGPKNVMESVNSALSAATKSYSYVSKGFLETEPIIAKVDTKLCVYSDACSEACPFDAISKTEIDSKPLALINNSVCKGCGMCLPVCPTDAIDLIAYSNKEIEDMIDALSN